MTIYIATLVICIPPEPGRATSGIGTLVLVAASIAIGWLVRSWWPILVPFVVMSFHTPYGIWFSSDARSGFAPDPVLLARVDVSLAAGLALAVLLGRVARWQTARNR